MRPGGGERTGPPPGGAAAGGAPRSPPAARSTGPGRAVPAAAARSPVSGAEPSTAPHRGCLPRPLPGMRWPSGSSREREASVISRNSLPRGDPDPGPVKFRSVPAARLRGRSELCCLLLLRGDRPHRGRLGPGPAAAPRPELLPGLKLARSLRPPRKPENRVPPGLQKCWSPAAAVDFSRN